MEKASSFILQEEWHKLLNKLQIHLEQKQYHLLSVELKLAAAILQQAVSSQLLATLSEATIGLIKNCLIAVGQAADEKDYRDQFHKILLNQWHTILINKNAGITETFLKEIRHKAPSSIMVKPRYHFNHDFNALYVVNSSTNPYQFLKSEQEDRLKRLEGSFERNRYVVYAEIVVTYVRCLIRARQVFTAEHLVALGSFIESLGLIASMQALGHEELWHYVLPLQNDLADELIYAHYQSFMDPAHLLDWQQKQPYKTGESLLILQTIVHTLNLSKAFSESALVHWLQALNLFTDTWVAHQPQKLTCELLLAEQHRQALDDYRYVFSDNEASFPERQKIFSAQSLGFLHKLTEQMAQLLGEKPCEWALWAMGSSARSDRRPYSDVELMLLYQTKPNVSESHLQTYLYFLLGGLEIAIKQLGETHREYTHNAHAAADTAGFHLDSSCHILREELFNTPQNMVAQYFLKSLPRKQGSDEIGEEWHDWLHNRKFYALLFPKLIIGNEDLLNFYSTELQRFLTADVNASDQLDKLAQALAWSSLTTVKLPRHQVIALSCLMQVLQESQQQLTKIKIGDWVNLKDVFYKPFTYLALNLKLFYSLKAEHPADFLEEAAANLAWGASEVTKLLQAVLSYIGQLQAKLHLQNSYQEECFKWLNLPTENSKTTLTAQEYAGLSLITDSLLLPLFQYSNNQLKVSANSCVLIDILPFLLKSHLAARNESWLHRWAQHTSHSLLLSELLTHPLIQVLADYPSPNGWSPNYEQALCRWLCQLQTLITEHETPCLLEGIPTPNKQKTSSNYLPAEIVTQLFDPQGEFKGNVHDSQQSKVSQISWPAPDSANAKTFYFKVKPGNAAGLMGREFAVIDLHQLLGGLSHIALGWPLKLTYLSAKGPKVYYCWVSEGIAGKSLAQVMQAETDFAHFQAQLDGQSYSHLLVTHYLTCPEDAQPDNFKVFQSADKTKQILYGLDVGQSFVGTHDEKRKVLAVKTMLYLLEPAIHQALDTRVLTRLMLLDPPGLIKHWQANLKRMNRLFQSLFEAELAKTCVPKAQWSSHNQLVDLNEAVHLSVQKRLELLLNWLYQPSQKEKSGAMLLKALELAIALSYQSLRGKIKTPQDFYTIDPKAYVRNPNTGKMYSSTTYQQIQQQTLTPERLQASLALGEAYFATLDFRKITAEQEQHYVLALLQAAIQNKQRFTYLNLAGCTILNEKALIELLQKTTDLKELHLEDCPQFNLSTVLNIFGCKVNENVISYLPLRWDYEVLCPQLSKLSVTLGGNVHLLDIALTLIGRKQLVTFINQQQQSVENYLKRLLVMLVKKDSRVVRVTVAQSLGKLAMQLSPMQVKRVMKALLDRLGAEISNVGAAAVRSFGQLAGQLSPVQAELVMKALLDRLGDKNGDVRVTAARKLVQLATQLSPVQVELVMKALLGAEGWEMRAAAEQSLGQLAGQLSPVQVELVMKALLDRLGDKDRDVRAAAEQSLGQLAWQLSPVQGELVVKALLDRLRDKDEYVRVAAVNSLAEIFSVTTSLQWLQKTMLQIEQAAFKSLLESSMQTDQTILYKLFAFLDPKTLLEVVPQVNKDWQRWQKVYLQQQAQMAREQNFIFLEETPNKEVMDFHARFLYSQSVNHANVQKEATFVNASAKNAIQTKPTTTLGVTSKPIHLAQTNFFQLEKNMQLTVPKHYTVQINQQAVVFEVKAVIGDGDCGYTAFGIERAKAYQLLVDHLEKIHHLIKPAVQETLRTQAFIATLQREGRLTQALSKAYAHYLHVSHAGGEMPQQVLDTLDRAGEDLTILLAYIDYDVKAKKIDAGWSHPCILFALAEIQGIELHIWQCNEQAELVPHAYYPQHIPAQVNNRTDLLFTNNNHFERLELIHDDVQLTAQPSNTNTL